MLCDNNIKKLLGMEEVIVGEIQDNGDSLIIPVEMKLKEHCCPRCHTMTKYVHDYRMQHVKDLDSFGKPAVLLLRKRRLQCPVCNKRFAEFNPQVKKYQRTTQRLFISVIEGFTKTLSGTQIAKDHHISTSTAFRYFDAFSSTRPSLPSVISIDEFKGNADREKYQTKIVDPLHHKILDILPNRKENDVIRYFFTYTREQRMQVKYVVIDMNGHFERVVEKCFPKAQIILDHYHVIRQVHWALENARKHVQSKLSDDFRKYFKRSRYLLHKNGCKLTEEEKARLANMLNISKELANAYLVKEKFREVMNSKTREEASIRLNNWFILAELQNMPELRDCISCYHNWATEILNSVNSKYSNGYIEGTNNKTKVLKRVSYGIRSFRRMKQRILFAA